MLCCGAASSWLSLTNLPCCFSIAPFFPRGPRCAPLLSMKCLEMAGILCLSICAAAPLATHAFYVTVKSTYLSAGMRFVLW